MINENQDDKKPKAMMPRERERQKRERQTGDGLLMTAAPPPPPPLQQQRQRQKQHSNAPTQVEFDPSDAQYATQRNATQRTARRSSPSLKVECNEMR
ncbi:hypothetical protein CLCR_02690 [Cladophialophora carrionii]|uniref:Uncharacterized protein n=1 Tax=Cladophialophora carrionii TaxID=86049 RepID=A0A1C1CEZ4_9EURO|nr:hypothetical protein CLCR_02690 [Cladophialophora carrionii]